LEKKMVFFTRIHEFKGWIRKVYVSRTEIQTSRLFQRSHIEPILA
jgi:hypothetical protein